MEKRENPGRGCAHRALDILAIGKELDIQDPTQPHPEFQSELLAVASIMRSRGLSYHHAKTVCQLSGLGGNSR